MHDHQLDTTLYAASVLSLNCIHPELVESNAPLPDLGLMYQCVACKKKVIIPPSTLLAPAKAEEVDVAIAGILGVAFGEHWKRDFPRFFRKG